MLQRSWLFCVTWYWPTPSCTAPLKSVRRLWPACSAALRKASLIFAGSAWSATFSGPPVPWKLIGAALVVLGLLEERQHVLVAPALVAELAPVVVVPGVAAHVEHGVDRRRAAQRLAARPVHAAVVAMDLRHRLVAPVVGRLLAEAGEARRHLEQEGPSGRPGLEDQDAQRGNPRPGGWRARCRPSRRR